MTPNPTPHTENKPAVNPASDIHQDHLGAACTCSYCLGICPGCGISLDNNTDNDGECQTPNCNGGRF